MMNLLRKRAGMCVCSFQTARPKNGSHYRDGVSSLRTLEDLALCSQVKENVQTHLFARVTHLSCTVLIGRPFR